MEMTLTFFCCPSFPFSSHTPFRQTHLLSLPSHPDRLFVLHYPVDLFYYPHSSHAWDLPTFYAIPDLPALAFPTTPTPSLPPSPCHPLLPQPCTHSFALPLPWIIFYLFTLPFPLTPIFLVYYYYYYCICICPPALYMHT